jgi:nucleotide-binding universal stress UspA family protein
LHGHPADKIVELARREDVDAIVLGTRGHSRVHDLPAGSVAQAVMRDAPCAVIAYKPPPRAATAECMHSA